MSTEGFYCFSFFFVLLLLLLLNCNVPTRYKVLINPPSPINIIKTKANFSAKRGLSFRNFILHCD